MNPKRIVIAAVAAGLAVLAYATLRPSPDEGSADGSTKVFGTGRKRDRIQELEERVAGLERKIAALDRPFVAGISAAVTAPSETSASARPDAPGAIGPVREDIVGVTRDWKGALASYDQNRDGKLGAGEANVSPETFALMDENRDGVLDEREAERLGRYLEQAADYLKRRDKGDGAYPIAKAEFQGPEREFAYADRDQDGQLTEWEYVEFAQRTRAERNRFDANGDGDLTAQEMGVTPERFAQLDADRDGKLELWEVRRALYRGNW